MVRCWYVLDAIGSNLSMLSIRGTCHLVLGDRRARPSRGRFIILEYVGWQSMQGERDVSGSLLRGVSTMGIMERDPRTRKA